MKPTKEPPIVHYAREYSALAGLQQADRVDYTLARSGSMLCFSIGRRTDAAPASFYTDALDEETAGRMLCYLYENAILPEQMHDVLSDLCGQTVCR